MRWAADPCLHREHNPPMHLYIPPGGTFLHRCPGCGRTIELRSSAATY